MEAKWSARAKHRGQKTLGCTPRMHSRSANPLVLALYKPRGRGDSLPGILVGSMSFQSPGHTGPPCNQSQLCRNQRKAKTRNWHLHQARPLRVRGHSRHVTRDWDRSQVLCSETRYPSCCLAPAAYYVPGITPNRAAESETPGSLPLRSRVY